MTNKHDKTGGKLGKPLVLRLYEHQKELMDEFIKEENKVLVNEGHAPKSSSEYARMIFQKGLDALELA